MNIERATDLLREQKKSKIEKFTRAMSETKDVWVGQK